MAGYLSGEWRAAIPSLKKESPAYWNCLHRNNHDGTFSDVTEHAEVVEAGYGMGVAVGDYDKTEAGHISGERHR